MYKCAVCHKVFEKSGALRTHRFRVHNKKSPVIYQCYYCSLKTKHKWSLTRHIKVHVSEESGKKKVVSKAKLNVCNLCNLYECFDRGAMIDHYQSVHDVQINEKTLTFTSHDDFLAWKRFTESEECSQFMMYRGAQRTLHTTVSYYRCFRDGHYVPRGTGKRKLKVKGSCKIGSVCPASIKVTETREDGLIKVTYIPRHVGHASEMGRMSLNSEEKDHIARQLSAGVPIDKILDNIRDSLLYSQPSRIHLTTRKDLWNLKSSLQLQNVKDLPSDRDSSITEERPIADEVLLVDHHERDIEELILDEFSAKNQDVRISEMRMEQMKRNVMIDFVSSLKSATNCDQVEVIRKALSPVPRAIKALEAGQKKLGS